MSRLSLRGLPPVSPWKHLVCAGLYLALSAAHAPATAQTIQIPDIGTADKEIEAARPKLSPKRDPAPVIIEQDTQPLSLPSGETLFVREFKLADAAFIPESEWRAALQPYTGRALSMAQIEEAANQITALCRSHGYPIARAYVPRQDASQGVLTLRVLVGKYGELRFNNQSLVRDGVVQAPLQRLTRNDDTPVTRAALERAMLLVNDMPGAAMPELVISPGEAPGTSDFDVELKAGKRVQGYLLADNQGSEYTGKYRLNAGVEINSPFGIGDRLSFNGMASKDKGLLNGRLAYGFPLNSDGLRMEVAAYRTTYELGDVYKDLDATGQSNVLEAGLSYPLIRSNSRNLYLTANVASKQLRDEIGIADYVERKKAHVGSLGLRHDHWDTLFGRALFTEAGASISYGRLSMPDAQQEAANRNSIDSVGHYARLNLSLQAQHALTDTLSAHVSASAQKALMGKNLDSSEQMSISGASGVRAYREVVSGDNAYFLNAELRYQLPALGGLSHSLGVFSGTGRSHYENADHVTSNGIRLSDVGLSYYASYRSVILKVQLAHAVGSIPDEVADKGRTNVYVQIGLLF